MTKIELIQLYNAAKKRLNDPDAAFDAIVSKSFCAPVDLTPADCAPLTTGADIARTAYTGDVVIADREDRARLLDYLLAKNPNGGGRKTTAGASVKFCISIPVALMRRIDAIAIEQGVSRNKLIRMALEETYVR